jgi:hypothetical protein
MCFNKQLKDNKAQYLTRNIEELLMSRSLASDEINLLTKLLAPTLYKSGLQVLISEFSSCNSHMWFLYLSIYLSIYGSKVLRWASAAFSFSWSHIQSVGLLGRRISPSQGLYPHTEQHKHRIKAHNTDTHPLSGIRTPDPSVRASEDSSCLSPLGRCDRLVISIAQETKM